MDLPFDVGDLNRIENFLGQGDVEASLPALLELRDAVEEYVETEFATTDEVQYFCFSDAFERLAYRRVEGDPRTLVQVGAPFDRHYADLAFAYIQSQEHALARDALMQAVRWNPMHCAYRLDLAEVFHILGDRREWASLLFSVLERAADAAHVGRAYAGLGEFFLDEDEASAAAGCARRAARFAPEDMVTRRLITHLMEVASDAAELGEDEATAALAAQGIPTEPNAEIAICLIMCATDASRAGDRNEAARLTLRARDLVGENVVKALIQLVHESDAELAAERGENSEEDRDANA